MTSTSVHAGIGADTDLGTACAMRIGIYSGTFDPIHAGHVGFARAVQQSNGLGMVYIVPEQLPRGKTSASALEHRLEMARIALEPYNNLAVLHIPHAQFSIAQTLPYLREQFSGAELTFLLGSDVVDTFAYRWPALDELFASVSLAIGLRQSADVTRIRETLTKAGLEAGVQPQYTLHASPMPDASSRSVRAQIGSPYLASDIAEYIKSQQLYLS